MTSATRTLLRQSLQDDQLQFSQELRFEYERGNITDAVGGIYFFWQSLETEAFQELHNGAPIVASSFGHSEKSIGDQTTTSTAVFGDLTYNLTNRLAVFGGLRLTLERVEIDYRHISNDGTFVLAPGLDFSDSLTSLTLHQGSAYLLR